MILGGLMLCASACFNLASAQETWHNPANASTKVVQGQGWQNEPIGFFHRLPDRAKSIVRKEVWNLSTNSAGLAIHFHTDASLVKVRFKVSGAAAMPHMPATGVSGFDLYQVTDDGSLEYVKGIFPWSLGDTAYYSFSPVSSSKSSSKNREYRLFLPLYNEVTWLEVGVPNGASFHFIPSRTDKPIVVYGTSIAQGACASRPAMAWTNILSRNLNQRIINLGFSGNGRMEKELIDFILEADAKLIVLDCLPNLGRESDSSFVRKIRDGVAQLRAKTASPILLVENTAGTPSYHDASAAHKNALLQKTFNEMRSEGVKGLHYLSCKELSFSADATVDGIHPNDFGMVAVAAAYEKKIRKILHLPRGSKIL